MWFPCRRGACFGTISLSAESRSLHDSTIFNQGRGTNWIVQVEFKSQDTNCSLNEWTIRIFFSIIFKLFFFFLFQLLPSPVRIILLAYKKFETDFTTFLNSSRKIYYYRIFDSLWKKSNEACKKVIKTGQCINAINTSLPTTKHPLADLPYPTSPQNSANEPHRRNPTAIQSSNTPTKNRRAQPASSPATSFSH